MEKREILERLKNDVAFAVQFAIDNNYSDISARYENIFGRKLFRRGLYENIMDLISARDNRVYDVLSVSYINEAPNYTGGLSQEIQNLKTVLPTGTGGNTQKINWGNVFTVIGAIGTALGGVYSAQESGTQYDPYELARQREEEARRRAEEEARRKRAVAWVIGGTIAVVVIIIVIIAVTKPKKP